MPEGGGGGGKSTGRKSYLGSEEEEAAARGGVHILFRGERAHHDDRHSDLANKIEVVLKALLFYHSARNFIPVLSLQASDSPRTCGSLYPD